MTRAEKFNELLRIGELGQLSDYVLVNHDLFNLLIDTYIVGPSRITQRAAYPLTTIATEYPGLLEPHLGKLLKAMKAPDASMALKRNTVRMLQFVIVPRRWYGDIINVCFRYLSDKREAIAVKVFSMTVIERLSSASPEIRHELRIVIEDQLPYAGPAFRSRAAKMLRKLNAPG